MNLNFNQTKRIMKNAAEDLGIKAVAKPAVLFLNEMLEQFIRNTVTNATQFTKESKRTTLMRADIEECLDRVSLILKNYPKVGVDDENKE